MKLLETGLENFDTIYADMKQQFPQEELKDYTAFLNLLKSPCYKLLCLYENESLCGYIIIYTGEKYLLVDYIAILKSTQSKGLGSKIIQLLPQIFKDKAGCLFEVEKISDLNPQTRRRVNFYLANGAQKLDINYIYPNSNGGLPMDLYYMNFTGKNPIRDNILKFIKEFFDFLHKDIVDIDEIYSKII